MRGFYERTDDARWEPFQPFVSWPNVNTRDPDLRFVDLTGDGLADILITEGDVLTWYPSLAEEGFGPAVRVSLPLDEEQGPRLVFADGTQSIYLADMSGDGLRDLVRIRNGEVCYWPNRGYGRFGAKVTMDNAPWFDNSDQFDQRRIRLADTDGSGTTDILYLRRDGVQIYFNQSGNRWSEAVALPQFPPIDNISSVQALDLLGNGTACLVWSSPLPGAGPRPMRYLALMGGKAPLARRGDEQPRRRDEGALRAIDQVLPGRQARRPALGHPAAVPRACGRAGRDVRPHQPQPLRHPLRLPPRILRRRRARVPRLRHGGARDTEEFEALAAGGAPPEAANLDAASHVPPVLTRTWFHTGVFIDHDRVSRHLAHQYYGAPDPDDSGLRQPAPGLSPDAAAGHGPTGRAHGR